MAKSNRIVWRWTDKDGNRHTTSRRPAKSRVGSGRPRAYGDFRDYSDVGGGLEALIPPGDRQATSDPEVAEHLASERADELREAKRTKIVIGVERTARLGEFSEHHLKAKAQAGKVTDQWLASCQIHLEEAVAFLGADRLLTQIRVQDLQEYLAHLREIPNGRGGTLSGGTQRKYLNSLSNLFRRAQAEGCVPPGYNPISAMMDKPTAKTEEADWLEVPEAALLLEAARLSDPNTDRRALPFPYELLGMALLTGLRKSELLGLTRSDLDFDRRTVTVRPNEFRGLKTQTAHRVVPMPTQLVEILRPYVYGDQPKIGLLFPSPHTGRMVTDCRKLLDRLAGRIGLEEGRVRLHGLRHSFCAAALQTLDRGKPISKYTVAMWMGHGGTSLVNRIYGHLGEHRHRGDEVEFRVENHEGELDEEILRELRRAS